MSARDKFQKDGWCYDLPAKADGGDCRKLVTLAQDGMAWIGIRAFDFTRGRWVNNGEPSPSEEVQAWRHLPDIARGFWVGGRLDFPVQHKIPTATLGFTLDEPTAGQKPAALHPAKEEQ